MAKVSDKAKRSGDGNKDSEGSDKGKQPVEVDKDHEDVAKRLARIAGHATSLKRMWEEHAECDETLTQISAVRAALDQVGKVILQHHINHCMREAVESGHVDDAIKDLKKALDRFV